MPSEFLSLRGIRVQLSGSVPDDASSEDAERIKNFVVLLGMSVLQSGGSLVHGSHPSILEPIEKVGTALAEVGGRASLVLVRAAKYCQTEAQQAEVESQRAWATVEIIPTLPGDPNTSLVPMREWMADRSDVVIAVGGRRNYTAVARAGVALEIEHMLARGKPAFIVSNFGGSTRHLLHSDGTLTSRLQNGWTAEQNVNLTRLTNQQEIVDCILNQVKLLPILRLDYKGGRRFRILALDGGGIRGAFTAAALAVWSDIEACNGGRDLIRHFDLVAGTSTGGILAIGLGLGLLPQEMLNFYRERGPTIFPKGGLIRQAFASRYDSGVLHKALIEVFGENSRLSQDSICRLVIPTVRAETGQACVITTKHHPDRREFADISAVEAALATSAAPTFFRQATVRGKVATAHFFDGGVWANNPILAGIAEAVRFLGVPPSRIEVLSVGTLGHENEYLKFFDRGFVKWARPVSNLFMDSQQSGTELLAAKMLGVGKVLRVTENLPRPIGLGDAAALEELARRGQVLGQESYSAVRQQFFDGYLVNDWRPRTPQV